MDSPSLFEMIIIKDLDQKLNAQQNTGIKRGGHFVLFVIFKDIQLKNATSFMATLLDINLSKDYKIHKRWASIRLQDRFL